MAWICGTSPLKKPTTDGLASHGPGVAQEVSHQRNGLGLWLVREGARVHRVVAVSEARCQAFNIEVKLRAFCWISWQSHYSCLVFLEMFGDQRRRGTDVGPHKISEECQGTCQGDPRGTNLNQGQA